MNETIKLILGGAALTALSGIIVALITFLPSRMTARAALRKVQYEERLAEEKADADRLEAERDRADHWQEQFDKEHERRMAADVANLDLREKLLARTQDISRTGPSASIGHRMDTVLYQSHAADKKDRLEEPIEP